MAGFEYNKVKSTAKQMTPQGPALRKLILGTMKTISTIVGDTLGPGGRQVMIERFEHGMPPQLTKDGVTVIRSLGFQDATAQCILETARDASVRTATEAGDGTTTAAILSEAVMRLTDAYCKDNPRISPQKVVRYLESQFRDTIAPTLAKLSIKIDSTTDEGQKLMRDVAKMSANGDGPLADAVMQCFDLVGDEGNVTILELAGPSSYEVEKIEGFPISIGYEESCAKFYPLVINDAGMQRCIMENPVFVLYHGTLSDVNTAFKLLSKVGDKFAESLQGQQNLYKRANVVFFAIGFSEQVLATFCGSFKTPNSIRILPVVVPKSALANTQVEFLNDLAAITGATVFDPVTKPLDSGELSDLGPVRWHEEFDANGFIDPLKSGFADLGPGITSFESTRYRSSLLGRAGTCGVQWEDAHVERVAEVEQQLKHAISDYDRIMLQERLGKLSGGIAKLKVIGASNGELKEKRDRAEDAVCAVRGAVRHGCLPGGGWALLKLAQVLPESDINNKILKPALMEPVHRLLFNLGFDEWDHRRILEPIYQGLKDGKTVVYDVENDVHGDAVEMGILDSTPAVVEAVRNSISIASLLGTLGATVCFQRDGELERTEARATQDFLRNANVNEADERA